MKNSSTSLYIQSQAGFDSLRQLLQDVLLNLRQNDPKMEVRYKIKRLKEQLLDTHHKLIFHEYIRIPGSVANEFIKAIEPLLIKCLTVRVKNAINRKDILQNIYLKLLTAKPIYPSHLRGYISSIVKHSICTFYETEARHNRHRHTDNNSYLSTIEASRLAGCYISEQEVDTQIKYLIGQVNQSKLSRKKKHVFIYFLLGKTRIYIMSNLSIGKSTYDRHKKSFFDFVAYHCH